MADTPTGTSDGFVDTQGFQLKLKNVNDDDTISFTQVLSLTPAKIEHSVDFNQLTNDTVEKLFGLTDAAFDVKMMVTQPEINLLLGLALPVNAELPSRFWTVTLTDVSGGSTDIEGDAFVSKLDIIDPGVGFATLEMTLDFVSGATVGGSSVRVLS